LLYDVARFNFNSFVVKDFDLEQMNFGRLGMLVVKGFDNQNELNHYRSVMSQNATLSLPKYVRPIEISVENFDKLLKSGGTFDEYFKFINNESYELTEIETLWGDIDEEADDSQQMQDHDSSGSGDTDIENVQGKETTPAATQQQQQPPATNKSAPASPKTAPAPTLPAAPVPIPEYPSGSEGDDDPLLD
ncbi:MAG: hypothetical protein K2O12_06785, partial [Muribaculaceae bacterium]|nr:hypothetical protein [Muribaculaceae bacterium]